MPNASTRTRPGEPTGDPCLDAVASEFAALRPRLLRIAYRIVGRWTEAEDIVQDAWLRWQTYDRSTVACPTAFLVTTTTRLAINGAGSARARHESSAGGCLPEPADAAGDPALLAERRDDLEHGVALLLRRLAPTERAAYVLRQAFDYPYGAIAETMDTTIGNARQLASRARKHLAVDRRRPASRAEQQRLVHGFVAAARWGDVRALERVLAAAVVL